MSVERHVVRLFGPARETVGAGEVELALPPGSTASDAIAALASAHPEVTALLPRARVAVNLEYVDAGTRLSPGDEIAILPPVGGG
ncbi:MAG TPA: MoaD/ThiS family protein [Gemmatimonadota bacterium]|jgi:molybdopterin synthase catalytic subunit